MQENIRNFVIISHIDHGKSTLADRFLEITRTVPKDKMRPQYLDMMALEREKGITIKMQPVRMLYEHPQNQKPAPHRPALSEKGGAGAGSKILEGQAYGTGKNQKENKELYILNLIDTPGHVDFSYEVSRGLAAVEGAILLVDATKGIQAQTIHHLSEAKKQSLTIIPALNKIDLPQADIAKTKKELQELLVGNQEILEVSAKYGTNVEELLKEVIREIPPPIGKEEAPLRALIFDSQYDAYKGVIAFVRIVDGRIQSGEEIYLLRKKVQGIAKEIGYFAPERVPTQELKTGEIGYIATGIKEPDKVRVGDTITKLKTKNEKLKTEIIIPLPGYKEPKPVVFASIYPENSDDFFRLEKSLEQLHLTDPSFSFEPESKTALGQGFRCGFLGSLHAEIIVERLKREFSLSLVVSRPQVVYQIIEKDGKSQFIFSARDFPESLQGKKIEERWIILEVITPQNFLGPVLTLLENLEGHYLRTKSLGENRLILTYEIPLREIMIGSFYDRLKGVSQGFASLNYEIADWRKADLVKLEILIAGQKEEFFSQVVSENKVFAEARKIVKKLKEILPRQQFAVALQAKVGGKIIARETISAQRKDVTAPLYGGDYTRKRKLLEKQKKGKKELKEKGRIYLPSEVFLKMLRE